MFAFNRGFSSSVVHVHFLFHFTFALHHPRDNKEQGMNSVLVQFNSTSKCRTLVWTLLAFNAFAVQ